MSLWVLVFCLSVDYSFYFFSSLFSRLEREFVLTNFLCNSLFSQVFFHLHLLNGCGELLELSSVSFQMGCFFPLLSHDAFLFLFFCSNASLFHSSEFCFIPLTFPPTNPIFLFPNCISPCQDTNILFLSLSSFPLLSYPTAALYGECMEKFFLLTKLL